MSTFFLSGVNLALIQLVDHCAYSYHTPSGVVSGIQWMKVEHPTSVGPPGVQPYANGVSIPSGKQSKSGTHMFVRCGKVPGGWNASGQVPSAHEWYELLTPSLLLIMPIFSSV